MSTSNETHPHSNSKPGSPRDNEENTLPQSQDPNVEAKLSFPVVGIGSSAGGIEALKNFFKAMPANSGMALVLIQHLAPNYESLAAHLLGKHTAMPVREAEEGIPLEVNQVYVIPPNKYLILSEGQLHLCKPILHRGIRMPIDYFFRSLAEEQQEKAIGILLSGTGTDGTLGLKAIKGYGGMTIAQDPSNTQYDGMVRSAIGTGLVDYILPIEQMPEALIQYAQHAPHIHNQRAEPAGNKETLQEILELLRRRMRYDFRCYKEGTLLRRISRRMGLQRMGSMAEYSELLRQQPEEINKLFNDLLISVTAFFRDLPAFNALTTQVIAKLVREKGTNTPLRIWVPGCATGEEAYSLAILFAEQLEAAQKSCPVQIFASDIDEAAIETARDGIYPENIAADVSPERLRRFFTKEDSTYSINRPIREWVTFAMQNLVADPPFSRLDLISCRNLLIYLQPELQRKVISLFHFALERGGYLFLGNTETIGLQTELFKTLDKKGRIYRQWGPSHRHPLDLLLHDAERKVERARILPPLSRDSEQIRLAETVQRLLLERYAPAAVLINRKYQILYYHGPTDRYLKRPSGVPTDELMPQICEGLHLKLRAALHKATTEARRISLRGGPVQRNGGSLIEVKITAEPFKLPQDSSDLLLVVFEDAPEPRSALETLRQVEVKGPDGALVKQLQQKLKTAKEELHSTIEEMEAANEELKSANEEIMSMNEEFQATNEELETSKEELETSKEELQSLNEELATVNSQLQNKLEELETVNNDLNNLLSNTDIATLFLDRHLCIKRFTPATLRLFNLISTDLGRPIDDISHKFQNSHLFHEAEKVLDKLIPVEQGVQTVDKRWYLQRLRPYQTQDKRIDGVVATFIDITERKQAEEVSQAAKIAAEQANAQKSQFLAATSHDLRQPLQALTLLNATLLQQVREQPPLLALLNRQRETLHGMGELLNALLDISRLDAGKLTPTLSVFPVDVLFHHLQEEFNLQAQEKGLEFRIRSCPISVYSDRALLERILSNFLANAIRYTERGKILLAGRRQGVKLHLAVWDTGCGFPQEQLKHIFNEFHQLKNAARERSKGTGLGLAIADRLARLLNHRLLVRSTEGKGSMFAVEVPIALGGGFPSEPQESGQRGEAAARTHPPGAGQGTILLVEDDPAVAESLAIYLQVAGFQLLQASHGKEALAHIRDRAAAPDAVISDYRLPGNKNGLKVIRDIRQFLARDIPAILLTGNTRTLQPEEIAAQQCHLLHKPIAGKQIVELLNRLMS